MSRLGVFRPVPANPKIFKEQLTTYKYRLIISKSQEKVLVEPTGIEPVSVRCERTVLPLNDGPISGFSLSINRNKKLAILVCLATAFYRIIMRNQRLTLPQSTF